MRRLLILVAALALLTTACKIEINAEFVINADKSGELVIEFGYDQEIADLVAAQGGDPADMLGDFDVEDVPGATVRTETRGDMTFQVITAPIEDVTAAEGLGGDLGEGLTDQFTVTFTEDKVTVQGSTTLDEALGDAGGGEDLGLTPDMMAQFFEVNIRVTMPGKVLDSNATSQDGNTLTWAVDLTAPALEIFAESDPNASEGSGVLLYVLIGAAAVLVLLLIWYRMRSKSGSSGAAAPATPQAPAADTPPPAPPPSE